MVYINSPGSSPVLRLGFDMISVKLTMPLWKWILLIVFGSALFLFLSQTVPVVGSFSNNIWIKALLLLLGAIAVLGLYAGSSIQVQKQSLDSYRYSLGIVHIGHR